MKKRTRHKVHRDEHTVLATLLADMVDRRRAGEALGVEECAERHPELAGEIQSQLALIEILESARTALGAPGAGVEGSQARPPDGGDLSAAIAELPERDQRLVYLRLFRRRPWPEIAAELGGDEEALRREHAGVLRRLIERCQGWLAEPTGSRSRSGVRR